MSLSKRGPRSMVRTVNSLPYPTMSTETMPTRRLRSSEVSACDELARAVVMVVGVGVGHLFGAEDHELDGGRGVGVTQGAGRLQHDGHPRSVVVATGGARLGVDVGSHDYQ